MNTLASFAVAGVLAFAPAAQAAVVLTTDGTGYSGPVLDLTGYTGFYTFFNSAVTLADGTVVTPVGTGGQGGSVIGTGGYGLGSNGFASTVPIVGSNWTTGYVELTFANAVSSFGGLFNYYTSVLGDNPFIAAYDAVGNLLGSFDLSVLAPISTPNGANAFEFRGIESDATDIASIRFGGSYLIYAQPPVSPVPVPAALPLLLLALGGLGVATRRRT